MPKNKTSTTPPKAAAQADPVAALGPSASTTGPAYGQGPFMAGALHPLPFQWDMDLFALAHPEGYLFLRHEELAQEVRDLTNELTEAFAELKVLRAPADCHAEVKAVIPAVACSGSVYIDGAGNLLTPKEAVRQLSMFQYGRDEERKIAA